MSMEDKKQLSLEQRNELLNTLKNRFEKNSNRHQNLEWNKIQAKLESNPQLRIQCQTTAPASKAIDTTSGHRADLSKGLYLFEDNTLGILVHPMDQSDTVLEHDKDEHWTLVTFGRFMEKGVIRRMRLRIVASNDTISDSQWLAWMQSFADSPLPLTA